MNTLTTFLTNNYYKILFHKNENFSHSQQKTIIKAIENNDLNFLKKTIHPLNNFNFLFSEKYNETKVTPLLIACQNKNIEIIDFLLEHNASFDFHNSYCFFSFFSAIKKPIKLGFFQINESTPRNNDYFDIDILDKIITNTKDFHVFDSDGIDIFSHLCRNLNEKNKYLADYILSKAILTYSKSFLRELPIIYAKNNLFAVTYLLEHNFDPTQKNNNKQSFFTQIITDEPFIHCLNFYDKNNPPMIEKIKNHLISESEYFSENINKNMNLFSFTISKSNDPALISLRNHIKICEQYIFKNNLKNKTEEISNSNNIHNNHKINKI